MKKLTSQALCFVLCLIITSCGDNYITPSKTIGTRPPSNPGADLPESIPESRAWNYPYPSIIEREYISEYTMFAHTKCLAWRITWPAYAAAADHTKIPTVFATINGALNSFNYLNNVDPQNTYKTDFSLYFNNKVEASAAVWEELDYADASEMETPAFAMSNQPLDNIIDWVTKRAESFELHWPGSEGQEMEYEEGDFIQFWLSKADLYGGIRIVSMNPRIIEVYLAVPNN